MRWKPNVTVAAVIEQEGRFLMVEEKDRGRTVLNQPAGHLDEGEDLVAAVRREVLEETTRHFEPEAVIGIYLYPSPHKQSTYLRVCFCGSVSEADPSMARDADIIDCRWMDRDELAAPGSMLRSPLVLQAIEAYLAGQRYPLDLLHYLQPGS